MEVLNGTFKEERTGKDNSQLPLYCRKVDFVRHLGEGRGNETNNFIVSRVKQEIVMAALIVRCRWKMIHGAMC